MPVPEAAKRAKKPGNNNLPDGTKTKLWRPVFISTYLAYVGSVANPWEIPVKTACEIMQLIWDAIFSDIPYIVTSTSSVYLIVSSSHALINILIFICRPSNELRTPGAM